MAWGMVGVAAKESPSRSTGCNEGLLKRSLAHGFCAEDFANVEPFYSGSAALVLGAHDLFDDGIHLVAQIIECCPVRIFNED
jgi:hypothetical protein